MAGQHASAAFGGLPKQFVSSLKVLFDILDRDQSGFVFYTDIEKYWDENAIRGLPMGVLPCLKRATAKSGLITFEKFVTALNEALFASTGLRRQSNNRTEKNSYRPQDFPRSTSVPVTLANYRPDHPALKGTYGSGFHSQGTTPNYVYPARGTAPERTLSPTRHGPTMATVRPNINPNIQQNTQVQNENQAPQNLEVKYTGHGRPLSERDPNQLQTKSDSAIIQKKWPRDRAQSENVSSMIQKFETRHGGSTEPGQYAGVPLTRGSKAQSMDAIVPSNRPLSPPSEANKENEKRLRQSNNVINDRYHYPPNRSHDRHVSPPSNQPHYNPGNNPTSPTNRNYYNSPTSPTPLNPRSPMSPTHNLYGPSPEKPRRDRSPSAPPGGQYHHQGPKIAHGARQANYFPPLQEDDEVERIYNQVSQDRAGNIPQRKVSSAMQQLDFDRAALSRTYEPTTHVTSPPPKNTYRKVREPRRHTLQNGVDFNMVKRMKQLEQERDVLIQGLEAVDRARDWYQRQIQNVQEKQKNIGKSQHMDYSVEAQQERMNFQTARIYDVNQKLEALVQSSERGFPLHMNLAIPSQRLSMDFDEERIERLRDQNRSLSQEVNTKQDRIAQLEKEKSLLVRELFEERAKRRPVEDASIM